MSVEQGNMMDLLRKYEPERANAIERHKTREDLSAYIWQRRNSPEQPTETEQWAWRERLASMPKTRGKR
jgi:hypothetical protein